MSLYTAMIRFILWLKRLLGISDKSYEDKKAERRRPETPAYGGFVTSVRSVTFDLDCGGEVKIKYEGRLETSVTDG